jgi:NAD(P)-dependent dehydrogenase (short-subunit alcohol dehydrogenase family)
MQVAGKVVVVTGGANGIGRALCEAFHRAGAAKVVVVDLDLAGAEAVAAAVDGAAFKCDVGQEKDIRHVIEETERRFGPRCSVPMPVSAAVSIRCRRTPAAAPMNPGPKAGRFMSWPMSMRRGI